MCLWEAAFTENSETLRNTFEEILRWLDENLLISRHLPILCRRVCIVLFRPALFTVLLEFVDSFLAQQAFQFYLDTTGAIFFTF